MDQIISIVQTVIELLQQNLIIVLGVAGGVILLLLVLAIISRRNKQITGYEQEEDSGDVMDFLEVGPEPVIVYRSSQVRKESDSQQEQVPTYQPPSQTQPESQPAEPQQPETKKQAEPSFQPPVHQPEPKEQASQQPSFQAPAQQPESKEQTAQQPSFQAPAQQPEPKEQAEPQQHKTGDMPKFNLSIPGQQTSQQPQPQFDPEPVPEPPAQQPSKPEYQPQQTKKPSLKPFLESNFASDTLNFFIDQGYEIEKVVYQGMFGADYIAVRPGSRLYIQVKDWKKKTDSKTVQEVRNYATNHQCSQAILIVPGKFTRDATKAATRLGVLIWDKKELQKIKEEGTAI